jgi:FKBP-type peptidyl-prolyl cis-trans isomerase FkpA
MTLALRLRPVFGIALLVGLSACGSSSPTAPDQSSVAFSQTDLTVGTGAEALVGTTISINEGGWLYSESAVDHKGTQFDASSFAFTIGVSGIIQGFDTGVRGMKVGGVRRLIIPPSLGYGTTGNPNANIPPNAALVFDVQLVAVQ